MGRLAGRRAIVPGASRADNRGQAIAHPIACDLKDEIGASRAAACA